MKKILTFPIFMLLTLYTLAQPTFSIGLQSSATTIQQPIELWSHIEITNTQGSIYNIGLLAEEQWGRFTLRSSVSYDRTIFSNMNVSLPLYALFVPDDPNSFLSDPVLQKQDFTQLGTSIGIGLTFLKNEKWELDFITDIQARFTVTKQETYSGYHYNALALPPSLPPRSEVTYQDNTPNFHRGNLLVGLKASYQFKPDYQLFLMPYGNALEYLNTNFMNSSFEPNALSLSTPQWLFLKSFGASFGVMRNF